MNICMFTNTYLPHVGGVARSVHFFAEDLRRQGNRVLVVAPTFPEKVGEPVENDDNVLRVPALQNFNGSDFSVRIPIPFFIDEEIDAFQPDVVHSHHPFLLGDAAIRAAYRRNLPLVFTHHTLYEEYTHYVSADSDMMRQLAINLSTEFANLCTSVVAPSDSIAKLIAKRGVHQPITVIPTGVDIDYFGSGDGPKFRKDNGLADDALIIGHLGRLAPEKNLDYLCRAVIKAMDDTSEQLRFLVVGSGSSEKEIQRLFTEAGRQDQLFMAGEKKGQELVDAYAAMDLFVFSSKSETQGMVLVEAMAAGLPVVALNASGAREVVRDDVNGSLLDGDATPRDFAATILDIFADREKREDLRHGARETANEFSRKTTAEKMAGLYVSLQQNLHGTTEEDTITLDPLDELIHSLKIEWDLLSGKANALLTSLQHDKKETSSKDTP